MAIGRTRQLSISPGMTPDMMRLIGEQRQINKEFDRRKPVTSPTVFVNDSVRPPARDNPGRIIFVRQANNSFMGQYSDGSVWQTFLATAVSYATPTVTFGTSYAQGSATTTIRSDATFKYPAALMSAANSSTLTLTDDATDQTLAGSLGALNVTPAGAFTLNASGRITFNLANSSSASTFIVATNATASESFAMTIQGRPTAGTRTILSPNWLGASASDVFSSQVFRGWDSQFSAWVSGQITSCTIAPYDVSVCTIAPSASSGGSNNLYGYRCASFSINNTNATWAEVATAYFKGVRRSISSPTITTQAGVIIEPPTAATSDQIGVYVRQQTAQATATNRIGLKIDAQNSGTNKYAIHAITDQSYFGPLNQDDSVKHRFGTGLDATAYYDGTNMILDPDEVGTGRVLIGATGDDDMLLNTIEIDGDLNHDGTNVGFYGVAPTARSAAYTPTNVTTDRAYDANATTVDELADVLGTLIADLQATGIIA